MIRFKDGVRLDDLRTQTALALNVCDQVYEANGRPFCTVTSINDSRHSHGSLHFLGLAFDLRTRDDNSHFQWDIQEKRKLADEIRAHLPTVFDVVVEADHIHVEYQPKRAG